MNSPSHRLGDLQLRILQVLWAAPDSSVADVHAVLKPERELAHTTVATMLRKMEARSLVVHREDGRSFLYRAKVDPALVQKNLVGDLVTRLFDGDSLALVNHLLRAGEIELSELDELRERVAEAERKARKERS